MNNNNSYSCISKIYDDKNYLSIIKKQYLNTIEIILNIYNN